MDLIKFDKITNMCQRVSIIINKEAVSSTTGVTPDDILKDQKLYEAFGYPGIASDIRAEMIRTNTVATVVMDLKQHHGNVILSGTAYTISSYSLAHAIDECYGLLELIGLIE